MRDVSARVFGRELFLPVAAWIQKRQSEDIHFSELRDDLRKGRLKASAGPLSQELGELERLGMIKRGRRKGKYVPYRYQQHELWRLVRVATGLDWRPPRRRRDRR